VTEAWGLCLCSIVGVFWGAFAEREPQHNAGNLREWLAWLAEGKLRPHISATYPLEQAADALYEMLNRRVQGKVDWCRRCTSWFATGHQARQVEEIAVVTAEILCPTALHTGIEFDDLQGAGGAAIV
jgi:Zinc-binding dehydrogenase